MNVGNYSHYDSEKTIYIPDKKSVPVSCYAVGSRPAVNLSFTLNGLEHGNPDNVTVTSSRLMNNTFVTRIDFTLWITTMRGSLCCQSSFPFLEQRLILEYFTYGKFFVINAGFRNSFNYQISDISF